MRKIEIKDLEVKSNNLTRFYYTRLSTHLQSGTLECAIIKWNAECRNSDEREVRWLADVNYMQASLLAETSSHYI